MMTAVTTNNSRSVNPCLFIINLISTAESISPTVKQCGISGPKGQRKKSEALVIFPEPGNRPLGCHAVHLAIQRQRLLSQFESFIFTPCPLVGKRQVGYRRKRIGIFRTKHFTVQR